MRPISLALENNKDVAFCLVRAVSQDDREEYFIRAEDESQALFLRLKTVAYRQVGDLLVHTYIHTYIARSVPPLALLSLRRSKWWVLES